MTEPSSERALERDVLGLELWQRAETITEDQMLAPPITFVEDRVQVVRTPRRVRRQTFDEEQALGARRVERAQPASNGASSMGSSTFIGLDQRAGFTNAAQ